MPQGVTSGYPKHRLALASWCARTGGRRPFSEGATAPVCSWLHTNWRAPPRLLLRRTEFIPFLPRRSIGSLKRNQRNGKNGMNSVLRLPGYGSWGRARTGSWLRTNWRAPTIFWGIGYVAHYGTTPFSGYS